MTDRVGRPLVDGFGAGLYEVRTSHDREQYRVLFTQAHEGRNMKKQARDELEEMFEELGELEEVRALTRKKLLADALRKAMKAQNVTPAEMARRMATSRPTVYRLLDPAERGATLDTLERASLALGLTLEIKLVPSPRSKRRRRSSGRRAA